MYTRFFPSNILPQVAKTGKLLGQGLLKFLASVGKPELALAFIQDPLSRSFEIKSKSDHFPYNHFRFCLAEEAGDLKAAEASAASLNSNEVFLLSSDSLHL